MIAQLTGFILCGFCFISIGSVVKKFANWHISYFQDFLIGLALSNAFFTVISLGYPINNLVSFLFVAFVIGLILLNFNYEKIYFRRLVDQLIRRTKENPVLYCLLASFIILTFFQSLYSPSLHYDAGLYHVPAIKWIAEHKAIPGLVHLNSFLGYNFNIFSLDAAFYTLFQQPIYPVNFTITTLFSLWIVTKIRGSSESNQYLLAAVYLLVLYYLVLNFWPHVSTPSNDTLVFVLSSILLISVTDLNEHRDVTFSLIILSVYAVTVKLSAAPVLLVAAYLSLTTYYRTHKKQAVFTCIISGFILIPWLIKNVLLTGWLLFPFPALDLFSFDWKLPLQDVISLKEAIRNYYSPTGNSGSNVVKSWLFNQSGVELSVIGLTTATFLALLYRLVVKKIALPNESVLTIGVSVLGIVFICLNSPSLRYGAAFFLAAIGLVVQSFNYKSTISKYGFYVFGLIVVFIFLKDNWFHPWHFAKHITQRFLLPYPLVLAEKKEFAYFLLDEKIKCYYPIKSDQCFDQLLPCASRKIDGLHLRGKEIEQGFYRDVR